MNSLLDEALRYAQRGWYVVPDHSVIGQMCTCKDPACKVQGKHPRMERESPMGHMRGTGSRDPKTITTWWTTWPDSNVAIVCGKASGLVVVDIDARNQGFVSLAQLEGRYGKFNTVSCRSGGGGLHFYFRHPQRIDVRNRIGLFPGIDVKADKGRIVAPPSKHVSGNCYQWDETKHPRNTPLAQLPQWLLGMIQTQKGTGTWQAMRQRGLR